MSSSKTKKLNLGCGSNKLSDSINIDINEEFKPDLLLDFLKFPYPFANDSIDVIYFFHTIEHITKVAHPTLLTEFHRILHSDGQLIISYPEFVKIAQAFIDNRFGWRESFWEATIYGRQTTKHDYHVCAMDTPTFTQLLCEIGFNIVETKSESNQDFNTIVVCSKGVRGMTREEGVYKEIWG